MSKEVAEAQLSNPRAPFFFFLKYTQDPRRRGSEQRPPAYRHTSLMAAGPLARPGAAEPTQGLQSLCRLPTFLCLPAQPWLRIRGGPHVGGQGLMMATAMPSLSCPPDPRVQFWQMLFPADKIQTSCFFFSTLFSSSEFWEMKGEEVTCG